jgi:tetratricopeptide (TPR) repeat protein
MEPIDTLDLHRLNAALGWLELGNQVEAHAELDSLAPELRSHPAVLELRWQIFAKEKKWDDCVGLAVTLVASNPGDPGNWLNHAYALRRAAAGGLLPAEKVLMEARQKFPLEWMIAYNLACYACQLGKLKDALDWLEKAFVVGDPRKIKPMALEDADLEALWPEIGKPRTS